MNREFPYPLGLGTKATTKARREQRPTCKAHARKHHSTHMAPVKASYVPHGDRSSSEFADPIKHYHRPRLMIMKEVWKINSSCPCKFSPKNMDGENLHRTTKYYCIPFTR